MGRFERTTELDQDGVFAIGHTVTDKETGHQEHFGVDGLTPLGRSVSDGDGHMTHISSDGYTCLGHTHTDDDGDSTHTDEDDLMAVGHTDHEPDRDVHTDVDGISSRGSSVPGGSSGFQHFYGSGPDDESEDREPRSGSGASSSRDSGQSSGDGYDSDDDYDSDYETPGSASQQATSRTVPHGVETRWETWNDCYGYPIAVEVWYELQRDAHGNSVYAPRLVDPDKACRQTEENAAQRDSEESAFEEPFEGATRCRSQPCSGDALGWALCAVLGVAIVAGTTLALVFGLRNRHETSSEVSLGSTTEATPEKSLEDKLDDINNDLNEIIRLRQQRRYETPETPVAAPQYVAPQPRAPEPRQTYRPQPSSRAPRTRPEDVGTHVRHPVTSATTPDVETERERVNHALRDWNPGLSNAELRARAGALGSLFEDRPRDVHPRPIHPVGLKTVNASNPAIPSYEGPKWRPRMEPKREQYMPQAMPNWARQRR